MGHNKKSSTRRARLEVIQELLAIPPKQIYIIPHNVVIKFPKKFQPTSTNI
jgi:hypothetical protein